MVYFGDFGGFFFFFSYFGSHAFLSFLFVLKSNNILLPLAGVACMGWQVRQGQGVCVICEMMVIEPLERKASSEGSWNLSSEAYTSGNGSRGHGKLPPCCQ